VLAVAAVALASVGKPGVAHTRPSPSRYLGVTHLLLVSEAGVRPAQRFGLDGGVRHVVVAERVGEGGLTCV
jgi:hypothetical protein